MRVLSLNLLQYCEHTCIQTGGTERGLRCRSYSMLYVLLVTTSLEGTWHQVLWNLLDY